MVSARYVDFFLDPAFMGALVAPCVDDRCFFVARMLHGGTMQTAQAEYGKGLVYVPMGF